MKSENYQHESPSQTAGPYVHIGCTPGMVGIHTLGQDLGATVFDDSCTGQRICIYGNIMDGNDEIIKDAMVEIWQADGQGQFAEPAKDPATSSLNGWGRCACDFKTGEYRFDTIKPGSVSLYDGRLQAPHITLWIVARGINIGLHTRLYFDDEATANQHDPLLNTLDSHVLRQSMIARQETRHSYRLDIYLQGDRETVFLDI